MAAILDHIHMGCTNVHDRVRSPAGRRHGSTTTPVCRQHQYRPKATPLGGAYIEIESIADPF
jgi:hypothetical protein